MWKAIDEVKRPAPVVIVHGRPMRLWSHSRRAVASRFHSLDSTNDPRQNRHRTRMGTSIDLISTSFGRTRFEGIERSFARFDLDPLDHGAAGAMPRPGYHCGDRVGGSLDHRFDPAVETIAHPTPNAEFCGFSSHAMTKADALNSADDHHVTNVIVHDPGSFRVTGDYSEQATCTGFALPRALGLCYHEPQYERGAPRECERASLSNIEPRKTHP